MACLGHDSIFNPEKKNVYTSINIFLFGGVFGVFYAKIIIFMARVLVLSIKFLFHSMSGSKPDYRSKERKICQKRT